MSRLPPHRYLEFLTLSDCELAALAATRGPTSRIGRHAVIRAEGQPADCVYHLMEGWVASSVSLADGHRQIVKIHLPGDLMGVPSIALRNAAETLTSLTPAAVARVRLADLGRLFHQFPRLAGALFLGAQQERVMLMDRITSVGRTTADRRVAAFLLHLYDRLQVVDAQQRPAFELPLTQEQIGDVVGLTPVHVNRTLRELEQQGRIIRAGQSISLPDAEALREFAAMPRREWVKDVTWLDPPPPA